MNRWIYFYCLVAIFSFPSIGGCTSALPMAKVTLHVVNQDGKPVSDTKIEAGFWMGRENLSARPDKDGMVTFTSPAIADAVFTNEQLYHPIHNPTAKDKYYLTRICKNFGSRRTNVKDGKWQPWNPTITMVLKERRHPIPMYATGTQYTITLPRQNEWFGFDMQKCDLMPPHGTGRHVDLELRHLWEEGEKSTLQYRFPDEKAGAYWFVYHESCASSGSLRSPYTAEETNGYALKTIDFTRAFRVGYVSHTDKDLWENQGLIFRTRTKINSTGEVISAQYGKMYAPSGTHFQRTPTGNTKVCLCYYLNPTVNDTNIEFDPMNNLLKDKNKWDYVNP